MRFDPADFEKHYKAGKTQLVWDTISGDLHTPVGAYMSLCGDAPNCFLLESVEGGKTLGRYSIIGMNPDRIWSVDAIDGDTLTSLRGELAKTKIDIAPDHLPPMAVSGLFGYLGYSMIRLAEDIPQENTDVFSIPEAVLMRPQILVIFDNVKNDITFVAPVYQHAENCEDAADNVLHHAQSVVSQVKEKLFERPVPNRKGSQVPLSLEIQSHTDAEDYQQSVQKAIDYIYQGEIFQCVLSQLFSCDFDLPSFELYRALRRLNPSPFLFHLRFEGFSLVGASPEILVRVRDNTVTIRPIAGTRKRGANEAEDLLLKEDLLSDEKELAEHLMLLDLGRNDVGRVAEYGSVNVTERNVIELYSHVMHIVSNVEGTLREDKDIVDAILSGMPAGTVSGAPKIRAMQIIDELENEKRGYYGGMVGYLSGNGSTDNCIALRTALVKDGKMFVRAGGGIVADSVPASEHQECVNKAKALFAAAEMAVRDNR